MFQRPPIITSEEPTVPDQSNRPEKSGQEENSNAVAQLVADLKATSTHIKYYRVLEDALGHLLGAADLLFLSYLLHRRLSPKAKSLSAVGSKRQTKYRIKNLCSAGVIKIRQRATSRTREVFIDVDVIRSFLKPKAC